jgi:hypothetical protein
MGLRNQVWVRAEKKDSVFTLIESMRLGVNQLRAKKKLSV